MNLRKLAVAVSMVVLGLIPIWRPRYDPNARRYARKGIRLPRGHKLPLYQSLHSKYDSPLLRFTGQLGEGSLVIDVGANVGDTIFAINQMRPDLLIIGFEPDTRFFRLASKNCGSLSNVKLENLAVGSLALVKLELISDGTTARMKEVKSSNHDLLNSGKVASLDAYLEEHNLKPDLIKVDVDGFDFDVLLSGASFIERHKPKLFFEVAPFTTAQLEGYRELFSRLDEIGYNSFHVYTNTGQLLVQVDGDSFLVQRMLENLGSLSQDDASLVYFDVFAEVVGPEFKKLCEA